MIFGNTIYMLKLFEDPISGDAPPMSDDVLSSEKQGTLIGTYKGCIVYTILVYRNCEITNSYPKGSMYDICN